MNKKQWIEFCNGLTVGQIKKKKRMYEEVENTFHIRDCIHGLKDDEYMVIGHKTLMFPSIVNKWKFAGGKDGGDEYIKYLQKLAERENKTLFGEASVRFLKRGEQYNLQVKTGEERKAEKITLHKCAGDSVKKFIGLDRIYENYEKIVRRGWVWPNTHNRKCRLTQNDLIKGWLVASYIIKNDLPITYSNPGEIFIINIPSTHADPYDKSNHHKITLSNVAVYQKDYAEFENWVNLIGEGPNIFSNKSKKYVMPEMDFTFHLVAASILRAHYTDSRAGKGKFSNMKSVLNQRIPDVALNLAMPPAKKKIIYGGRLKNNVLREFETSDGELKLRKPNNGEEEILHCVDTCAEFYKKSYGIDDTFRSLDYEVNMIYEERIRTLGKA